MSCPDAGLLQAHVEGYATPEEREKIRDHLENCRACREVVLALAAEPAEGDPTERETLAVRAGEAVGRYVVLRKLGEGGMGVVYAAYDPELDRQVALKLIRKGERDNRREVEERLLREGQAMARVAHPNVITVHDVGRLGDQVFVAMELCDGETLALWLAREKPPVTEVMARFLDAGRGLQAAHAAGLVHRDFKPNNVMIDRQGRVRVMDFGLARPAGFGDSGGASPTSRLEAALTASNVLLGTPAYMAPEQLERAPTDARTDQFSFCVALYEALCQVRPFGAADTEELLTAIREGRLQKPKRAVPRRWLEALARGLRASPEARFPSMEALLAALSFDSQKRKWRMAGLLGLLALLFAGGLVVRHENRLLCAGSERKLSGIWDAARREQLSAAFRATGAPYAETSFATVAQLFDRYAARWVTARTDACEATRKRGEQSEALLDRRMSCFDDRLGQLAATSDLLAHADSGAVEHAVQAASALPPLDGCDGRSLRDTAPPPNDPRRPALEDRLHRLIARYDAGQFDLPEGQALVKDVDALGYLPLSARAHHRFGDLLQRLHRIPESAQEYRQSVLGAERGRDDEEAALAWNSLAELVAVDESKPDEAMRLLELARAKLDRAGGSDRDEESLFHNVSVVAHLAGRYEEALAAAQKALELGKKIDPDGLDAVIDLANLGAIYGQEGNTKAALPILEEVVALYEKKAGADHPRTFYALLNLGSALNDAQRPAESLPIYDRALAIAVKTHLPEVDLGSAHSHRAMALGQLHHLDQAIAEDKIALAILEKYAPPGHNTLVDALTGLGYDELDAGNAGAAVAPLERALSTMEEQKVRPLDCADIRFTLARALYQTGKKDRARNLAAVSEAVFADAEKRIGGDFPARKKEISDWLAAHH